MKIRGFGWGIVCVSVLSLVTISGPIQPQDQAKELVKKMILSESVRTDWEPLSGLARQIITDFEALKKNFSSESFSNMGELFAKRHGTITGRDYMKKPADEKFWKGVYSKGTTLDIKIVTIHVTNALGSQDLGAVSKDKAGKPIGFDAMATVIAEFHVIMPKKPGSSFHNDTYPGELGYRHQLDCHWEY